jgi:putative FmdB family regulatory protein
MKKTHLLKEQPFQCKKCSKTFTVLLGPNFKSKDAKCPECKSKELSKVKHG